MPCTAPMRRIARQSCLSSVLIALALTLPARPLQADSQLERALLGLGAAAIINGITRGGQKDSAKSSNSGGSPARVDPAREAAKTLQRNLNQLGFNAGPVDGHPGAQTREATAAYQASRGFAPTGTLSDLQRLALDADARRAASGGVETPGLRTAEIREAPGLSGVAGV